MGEIWNIGLGVHKYKETKSFYENVLGFEYCLFQESNVRNMLLRYTNNTLLIQDVCFLINKNGGAGIEIWNTINKIPHKPQRPTELENTGILAILLQCKNIYAIRSMIQQENIEVSTITDDFLGQKRLYIRDNEYNMIGIIGNGDEEEKSTINKNNMGGVCSIIIGTHNMEATKYFYKEMGGFDTVMYDKTGIFEDFCFWENNIKIRRAALKRSDTKNKGVFGNLMHVDYIELVQVVEKKIDYKHKNALCYGQPGFFKIGFDIENRRILKEYTISVDSTPYKSALEGNLFYKEDANAILSESIEIKSIRPHTIKKNIYMFKGKRKPLSKFRIKALFTK